MNDHELDEMLNTLETPVAPSGLRDKVRAGFRGQFSRAVAELPRPRLPRLRIAFAFAGVAAALFLATAAFPQVGRLFSSEPIPYSVDYEFVYFPADREPNAFLTMTSYSRNAEEVALTWGMPQHPLAGPIHRTVGSLIMLVAGKPKERLVPEGRAITGCGHKCFGLTSWPLGPAEQLLSKGCATGTVIDRESILGHQTVAVRLPHGDGARTTFWLAPDLGCHALRMVLEDRMPDGSYQRTVEKRALRVNH